MKYISEDTRRTLLAVVISPLAIIPALVVAVTFAFFLSLLSTHEIPTNALSEYSAAIMMALVGLIYGYAFMLLYGFPVYLVLKKLKMQNIVTIAMLSTLPATIVGVSQSNLVAFLFIGYFSLWVAIAFWWLAPKRISNGSNNSFNLTGEKDSPSS